MNQTFNKLKLHATLPGELLSLQKDIIIGENILKTESNFYSQIAGNLINEQKHFTIIPEQNYLYLPQTRDFIIGRISALRTGAWSVDLGALQHGSINIDSIHLPGLLRIKSSADEFHQRAWLAENEVIAAEVRSVQGIQLNARSESMGKLSHGFLIEGRSWQVKTLKNVYQNENIRIMIGRNGWIWISGAVVHEGESNSVIDARRQEYSEEELLAVGRCIQRVQGVINAQQQLLEETLFE